MTQSSWKRDTESKCHPGVKLAPVRVFSCKHPQSQDIPGQKLVKFVACSSNNLYNIHLLISFMRSLQRRLQSSGLRGQRSVPIGV